MCFCGEIRNIWIFLDWKNHLIKGYDVAYDKPCLYSIGPFRTSGDSGYRNNPKFFGVGWLGEVKVSCSFCHWGAQLILAYSWARPAILVADMGKGGMWVFFVCFFFVVVVPSLSFIFLSLPYPSISSTLRSLLSFLPFSGKQHKITHKGWRVV